MSFAQMSLSEEVVQIERAKIHSKRKPTWTLKWWFGREISFQLHYENQVVGKVSVNQVQQKTMGTWNPNGAPCFGLKSPCFAGLTFKNRGHLGSRYLISALHVSAEASTIQYKPIVSRGFRSALCLVLVEYKHQTDGPVLKLSGTDIHIHVCKFVNM